MASVRWPSLPGKIIQSLKKAKSNNSVFCLDEVDKKSLVQKVWLGA